MTITSITNFKIGSVVLAGNRIDEIYVQTIMIETLKKLFAIKMVAKSSFGFCNKCNAFFDGFELILSNSSLSGGDIEKKETSDEEARAEPIMKITKINEDTISGISDTVQSIASKVVWLV